MHLKRNRMTRPRITTLMQEVAGEEVEFVLDIPSTFTYHTPPVSLDSCVASSMYNARYATY